MKEEFAEGVVGGFYRCRLKNDLSGCLAYFSPDATLRIAGSPDTNSTAASGSADDTPGGMLSKLIAMWEWRSQKIESITIQVSRVAVHFRLDTVFIPTGDLVQSELLSLFTVHDGKITSLVEFVDTGRVDKLVEKAGISRAHAI